MKRHWFAVRTKPRREFHARQNLLQQGYDTYLPVMKRLISHARKKSLKPRPFFSGYLFIHVNPDEADWHAINSTYGVLCAVHFGALYPPVPDILIEELKAREGADGLISIDPMKTVPYRPGDRVLVRRGQGLIDAIFQEMKAEDRAVVLIELLRRQLRVEVSLETIEVP